MSIVKALLRAKETDCDEALFDRAMELIRTVFAEKGYKVGKAGGQYGIIVDCKYLPRHKIANNFQFLTQR